MSNSEILNGETGKLGSCEIGKLAVVNLEVSK
jgi:hypothetical protein